MARKPTASKEDLLHGIMKYLAENGIANATFRALAAELKVSTYTLVYYFGSKEQLLDAVVAEVEKRQREYMERGLREGSSLVYWNWCIDNPGLLRLDLEILLHERRVSADSRLADLVFRNWHQLWISRLTGQGFSREAAEVEATLAIAIAIGLQMDLVATGDIERTTRAFRSQHEQWVQKVNFGPGGMGTSQASSARQDQ